MPGSLVSVGSAVAVRDRSEDSIVSAVTDNNIDEAPEEEKELHDRRSNEEFSFRLQQSQQSSSEQQSDIIDRPVASNFKISEIDITKFKRTSQDSA